MKDGHDQQTTEIPALGQVEVKTDHKQRSKLGRHKRLPRQDWKPPEGAKPLGGFYMGRPPAVVPVAVVAREWGISARRVRMMLVEGRLAGRQLDNGYWEVFYPYSYVFGTRGPQIKRQRDLPPPPRFEGFGGIDLSNAVAGT